MRVEDPDVTAEWESDKDDGIDIHDVKMQEIRDMGQHIVGHPIRPTWRQRRQMRRNYERASVLARIAQLEHELGFTDERPRWINVDGCRVPVLQAGPPGKPMPPKGGGGVAPPQR